MASPYFFFLKKIQMKNNKIENPNSRGLVVKMHRAKRRCVQSTTKLQFLLDRSSITGGNWQIIQLLLPFNGSIIHPWQIPCCREVHIQIISLLQHVPSNVFSRKINFFNSRCHPEEGELTISRLITDSCWFFLWKLLIHRNFFLEIR